MENWIVAVETNCNDPAREKEFNEWYDGVHLQDVLSIPGVVRASRYEDTNAAEGRGRFLALYEVETGDVLQIMAGLGEGMARWTEQGRVSELVTIVSASFYRQITPPVASR
jgi:hypothetical protein